MPVCFDLQSPSIVQQSKAVELFDESPQGFFREGLAKSFFDATANHVEWRRSVELLRDVVFHFTKPEESAGIRIFDDDDRSAARRLRPYNEVAAQFRRGTHVVSSVQIHVLRCFEKRLTTLAQPSRERK